MLPVRCEQTRQVRSGRFIGHPLKANPANRVVAAGRTDRLILYKTLPRTGTSCTRHSLCLSQIIKFGGRNSVSRSCILVLEIPAPMEGWL